MSAEFECILRLRMQTADPCYQLSHETDGSILIVDDEHGDADEPGMERLTPQAFAQQVADRIVGFDFDGMWRVVDVRPEAIR